MATHHYDPELADAVDYLPNFDMRDPAAAREAMRAASALSGESDASGVHIEDVRVPGTGQDPEVLLRVYRPEDRSSDAVVYDVHGGGFIMGDIETDHGRNIELSRSLGVVFVSVEYRLAPEVKFPGPLDDVYAALIWIAENAERLGVNRDRIVLHGLSVGATLCAALTLLVRDKGGPSVAFQFLMTPGVDDSFSSASSRQFVDTPIWNRPAAIAGWDAYLGEGVPGTEGVSQYAAPARAVDLSGLPPAYISVMQFDPLRDEGIAYAMRLLEAGVSVELHAFPGTFHGSAMIPGAEVSRREMAEEMAVLRKVTRASAPGIPSRSSS